MKNSFLNALLAFNGEAMIEAYKSIQAVKINHDNGVSGELLEKLIQVIRDSLEFDITNIFRELTVDYQHNEVREYFKDIPAEDLVKTVIEYFDKEIKVFLE